VQSALPDVLFQRPELYQGKHRPLQPAEIERIAEVFFPWAMQMYVGCGTEPTTYKGFLDIITLGKKYKVRILAW